MSITTSPAWQALTRHAAALQGKNAPDIFLSDAARQEKFNIAFDGLRLNYAFQYAASETIALLVDLARQQKIEDECVRLFVGDKINVTENRAVLHTALRQTSDRPVLVDHVDVMPEIRATQKRIAAFVDDVRGGKWKGATGKQLRSIRQYRYRRFRSRARVLRHRH